MNTTNIQEIIRTHKDHPYDMDDRLKQVDVTPSRTAWAVAQIISDAQDYCSSFLSLEGTANLVQLAIDEKP